MTTTRSFKKYYSLYGPHFTKSLCDYAVNMMENESGKITPFTKQEIEQMLKNTNIKLEYNKLCDYIYVANMCKADFFGRSVPDEQHLCLYIKDVIDDIDGYDGLVFNRWYADMCRTGIAIDWENML